jgi:hypothetical protein
MSNSRFLQTFILTLVLPLLTYAAAPNERAGLSRDADSQRYLINAKEPGKTPGGPLKFKKFILKTDETPVASSSDAVDAKASEKPEAALSSAHSSLSGNVNLSAPMRPLFSSSSPRLTLIDKTYLDAYAILRENNSCSQFFGGPRIATQVLNALHPRLKKESLMDTHAAIQMFGPITNVTDFQTGGTYRLFKNALINLTGPFFQSVNHRFHVYFHDIGHFQANTREARVSMLLHELGHLLPGADGNWLLPDDGGNEIQSTANTFTIMGKCSEQIRALSLQRAETPGLEASTQRESKPPAAIDKETASDNSNASVNRDNER